MSVYLYSDELAHMIGCKPNQRAAMARWLEDNGWPFVLDRSGIPTVARAHHDRKLGIEEEPAATRFNAGLNPNAFEPLRRPKRR